MNSQRIILSLILFLAFATTVRSQDAGRIFSEVKALPHDFLPEAFEFSVGDHEYRITGNGKGTVQSSNSGLRVFDLRLPRSERLVGRLYQAEYEGDLLLLGDVGDIESAAGFIARLDLRTLRLLWKNSLIGFNVGAGLIYEGNAYVTAIGFIGKINLNSGRYAWKHTDLYDRKTTAFNSFDVPRISGEAVIFKEEANHLRRKVAQIIVNSKTGRILKIDL